MPKWIAAVSGKGGTGKSTVSAGLSRALARLGYRVLIMDLDVGLRSQDLLLGLENRVVCDLGDVLHGRRPVADALVPVDACPGMSLLCGPSSHEDTADFRQLCAALREAAAQFDYVVLDLPAGLGLSVELTLELADLAAVVTLPDLVAMRDARTAADALLERGSTACRLIPIKTSHTPRKPNIHIKIIIPAPSTTSSVILTKATLINRNAQTAPNVISIISII